MASVFEDEPGVQMFKAHDGDQALQMAAARPPILVVARRDVAKTRRIRGPAPAQARRRTTNSPSILVPSMDGGSAQANTLNLAAEGFMTKLFSARSIC